MECFFIKAKESDSILRSSCDQLLAPTTMHFQFCIPDASRQAIFAWIWGSLPSKHQTSSLPDIFSSRRCWTNHDFRFRSQFHNFYRKKQ